LAYTKKITSAEANQGEAMHILSPVALFPIQLKKKKKREAIPTNMAVNLALREGCNSMILEGDSLIITIVITQLQLLSDWSFSSIIVDINSKLQ
jgi:hypothetical protein